MTSENIAETIDTNSSPSGITADVAAEIEVLQETPAENQQTTQERVAKATGILALGNIASRVLGLARVVVQTNLFGAGTATDAFKTATLIPTALYDLLIAGHVNGAIIPVLSEVVTLKGKDELWRLVSILFSMVTVILSGIVLALQAYAPQVIAIFSQADDQTRMLATDLFRITLPALIFMGIFAVLSGTLYALKRFTFPALAGVIFNGAIVAVTVLFVAPPQNVTVTGANGTMMVVSRAQEAITVMAIGWLAGAVLQLVMQLFGLRDSKLRFTLNWRHPALRRILTLYTPVMFSLIMDTLVIRPFSYILADRSGVGAISYMDYATMLIQFPQGLVATAISIAILPTLAQQTAQQTEQAFKSTLGLGLRLATTLIVPATVGMFVLATPIIALLLQHGQFTAADTAISAQALRIYLIGLPFAAIDLLLVYAFYARQDTLTPALIGLFTLGVYMGVALLLQPRYGFYSLMVADTVKHILHALISGYLLQRRLRGLGGQKLVITLLKTSLAAGVMAVAALSSIALLEPLLSQERLLDEALFVGLSGLVSVLAFGVTALLLRIDEIRWITGMILRRLRT
jgi:putative peptidoglycan lipid II flippase